MNYTQKSFSVAMGSTSKEFADRWEMAFPKECELCGALVRDHGTDYSDGMIVGEVICPLPQKKLAEPFRIA